MPYRCPRQGTWLCETNGRCSKDQWKSHAASRACLSAVAQSNPGQMSSTSYRASNPLIKKHLEIRLSPNHPSGSNPDQMFASDVRSWATRIAECLTSRNVVDGEPAHASDRSTFPIVADGCVASANRGRMHRRHLRREGVAAFRNRISMSARRGRLSTSGRSRRFKVLCQSENLDHQWRGLPKAFRRPIFFRERHCRRTWP